MNRHCFKTNLLGFHSWTKICMVMLYCVISVVCLCCPILILPSFLLANRWNAPACQYMLKKPFTRAWLQIVLSSPLGFYFHSPAELTMYALLFISSTYRKNKMPVGLHFRVSPLILASSDTLPSLHPLTSLCFVRLIILPRLHHSSQISPHKMWLFGDVLLFRLIIVTNLIPKHYIWVFCPCSGDHCSLESLSKPQCLSKSDTNHLGRCSISHEFEKMRCS